MNILRRSKYLFSAAVLTAMVCGGILPAQAQIDISQVPLIVTSGAEPNVVFIIDDSGSMQWETMPDEFTKFFGENLGSEAVMWTYPRVANLHGGSPQYGNTRTVRFSGDMAAMFRSPHNNTVYYNPAFTYQPWSNPDGTLMPNANPEAAPNRPLFPEFGTRNLVEDNIQRTNWVNDDDAGSHSFEWVTFYPAVYYHFIDGDVSDQDSYQRVEIRPEYAPFEGHGRENRSDCDNGSCTYQQEIQNFANWYSYHRNRIFASRGAIGAAFAVQSQSMRVAYGTINQGQHNLDGHQTRTLVYGVRPFGGDDRERFFDELYTRPVPAAPTPLRAALQGAGEYFKRNDNRGPWSTTPGETGGETLECRQNFSILMSDGYWNGPNPDDIGNQDGSGVTSHTGPGGLSGGYEPGPPFADDHSDTLADVAMEYWKNDLRPDLPNRVPTTPTNPAFWQHMVTFTVGLGVEGDIDPEDAFAAIESGESIEWPDPHGNVTSPKIDDMLHAAVNSRGGFFSANDPDTFAQELSDVLVNISERVSSAAAVAANSTRLDTDTRIYLARFNSGNWTGDVLAFDINPDGSVGNEAWNAASHVPGHTARNIVTYNSATQEGVHFQWNNLSPAQQAFLNEDNLGEDRVAYLRGNQLQEQSNGGPFRTRFGKLGDIVNSAPAFMGTEDFGFSNLSSDPENVEATSYANFVAGKNTRTEMLFVGANDGMLHAFDVETGTERFAFIPNAVYPNLSKLTEPNYSHRFFVDGSPRVVDAYLPGRGGWRSILVGSTGAGGRSVFALDVTNPDTFGPSSVMWEFTHPDLGYSIGQPSIVRLPNGTWAAMFGNGYNSDNHRAKLFIVDLASGDLLHLFDTQAGSAADPNGLATPFPADLGGNRITDLIYAGDLHGNMWKFNVSGSNSNQWGVAFSQGQNRFPLFTAEGPSGERQPITVRPEVGRHPDGGQMVYFGTGKFFEVGDNIVPNDPDLQSFYGIRDNGSRITGSRDNELVEQTIIVEGLADEDIAFDYRIVSDNIVDYTSRHGWYLDLESPLDGANGERVINNAILRTGRIIFVTSIPDADACGFGGTSWLMELDAITGARLNYAVFDVDGDGYITGADIILDADGNPIGHVGGQRIADMVTVPHILDTGGDTEFKYMGGASGDVTVIEEAASAGDLGRQSWEQLR